jgi:hypothetical protein
MEIDLGLSDLDSMALDLNEINFSDTKATSSFGPGIELLMNDKKRSASHSVNVDLGELDNMENELNNLSSSVSGNNQSGGISGFASNLFNFGNSSNTKNDSKLGQATKETTGTTKTWDGFSKINEIPSTDTSNASANLTDREKRRKKKLMIKKIEEWYEKGQIKNITHFNNESDYQEVEDEYESFLEEKRKKDSIKLQGWWFMTFINSVEYANAAFNPFDINLDGWGEQISEDIDSYDEIFSELHEKYKGGKMAPELSLLLRLGFSAAVVNFTNKALSTATPGFNDVIRQSPELMKMFTNATVSSMTQQSPGFAFANNMMGNKPEQVNTSFGPPPAPVETKNGPSHQRPSMQFTNTNMPENRQDINVARGSMLREKGVDMSNSYSDPSKQERSIKNTSQFNNNAESYSQSRPEMKGPQNSDINNLLSGLKTRTINIHEQPNANAHYDMNSSKNNGSVYGEDDSVISIASLKDMQNASVPKRVNRGRNRSDKNTISLDI